MEEVFLPLLFGYFVSWAEQDTDEDDGSFLDVDFIQLNHGCTENLEQRAQETRLHLISRVLEDEENVQDACADDEGTIAHY